LGFKGLIYKHSWLC